MYRSNFNSALEPLLPLYQEELQKAQIDDDQGRTLHSMLHCTTDLIGESGDVRKECLLWHGGNWGVLYLILNGGFKGSILTRKGAALGLVMYFNLTFL